MRADRSVFERAGLASGLLTEEQIDSAWHALAQSSASADLSLEEITDEQLAAKLVELGHLNRWQAEQLCLGRTKFTLGAYRILDTIGQGGMGWVFKGEHELLGRIEAIKVLPKNLCDKTSIANFRREIRAQALLDHPNLVRLSYADTDGDTYFLVIEYVPGSDLRRLVHEHGPVSPVKAAILISQTAEALAYAHGQGLIHRDVKPGNLLITPEGRVKLTDLGLAFFSSEGDASQDEHSRAKPKHIVGTADYLAPEIIVAPSEVRAISDIYSLGCTLYYAVTGKVPFPGGDTADKLRRQLDETPIPPQRLNPEVDDRFAAVINAMMQKRPEDRIATAAEVVQRLEPWVASADASVWKEIGALAEIEKEQLYQNAVLADTKPAIWQPAATPHSRQDNTSAASPGTTTSVASSEAAVQSPAAKPTKNTLDRATTVMVVLAVTVALAAVYLVLSSF